MAESDRNTEQELQEASDAPLTGQISPDVAPELDQFIAQAAEANEAVAEAAAEDREFAAGAGLDAADFAVASLGTPFLSFDNVSKSFGDFTVLDGVSFFVNAGETLCILGRSGVGKSVSLQIIMGFLRADSGTVMVAGQDMAELSERELREVRRKVTMVFQNGALFDSVSVGENVAFPLRERAVAEGRRAAAGGTAMEEDQILRVVKGLLEMVGVAGMDALLPSDLSTGMRRSVAIARALAAQPSAVLYDEPTTMVDPLMAHLLGDLIQRLKQQMHLTSIVVTHDMRFAEKLADRVVFLHAGKARFFGTVAEMRASDDPILREFLELDALVLPHPC